MRARGKGQGADTEEQGKERKGKGPIPHILPSNPQTLKTYLTSPPTPPFTPLPPIPTTAPTPMQATITRIRRPSRLPHAAGARAAEFLVGELLHPVAAAAAAGLDAAFFDGRVFAAAGAAEFAGVGLVAHFDGSLRLGG